MRGSRSSATRRARSTAPAISRRSGRSASAARRCRRSRRCRISCCGRARGQQSGTEIRVNGGTIASVVEVGAPEGTLVEVNDLFYNLPARRKFLKSDGAESAQVSRIVTQLALAYPEVGFTLTSAGRTVLQCPPAVSLRDRLYQLYGERSDLIDVGKEAGGMRLTGYIAALAEQGPTRGPQNVFINRRIVKDRTIAHAIIDAYSQASIKERSPEVHLFIEMAPDAVDVNVHPTKAEVRFRDQSLVHEVVRRALMDALGAGRRAAAAVAAGDGGPDADRGDDSRRPRRRRVSEPLGARRRRADAADLRPAERRPPAGPTGTARGGRRGRRRPSTSGR